MIRYSGITRLALFALVISLTVFSCTGVPAPETTTPPTPTPASLPVPTPTPIQTPKLVSFFRIDAHNHINPGFSAGGLSGVDLLMSSMDKASIGKAVLFRHPEAKTADVLDAYRKYPDRILPCRGDDGLDVNDPTTLNAIRADLDTGYFRGLGEIAVRHSGANINIPADHPVMLELFKLAAEHHIPVTIHLDSPEKGLAEFERALNQCPSTTFIWAHCGPSKPDILKGMLDRHSNLYADLSTLNPVRFNLAGKPGLPPGYQIESPEWIRLMEAYPTRFLFGTDPWFIEAYMGLPEITAWVKDNVFRSFRLKHFKQLTTATLKDYLA